MIEISHKIILLIITPNFLKQLFKDMTYSNKLMGEKTYVPGLEKKDMNVKISSDLF